MTHENAHFAPQGSRKGAQPPVALASLPASAGENSHPLVGRWIGTDDLAELVGGLSLEADSGMGQRLVVAARSSFELFGDNGYVAQLDATDEAHVYRVSNVLPAKDYAEVRSWISVDEATPPVHTSVLVFGASSRVVQIGARVRPSVHVDDPVSWLVDGYPTNVTHWMSLPAPPTGGAE